MTDIRAGNYFLNDSYLGAPDLTRRDIAVADIPVDLGILRMLPAAVELAEATVTATRALVGITPDRTLAYRYNSFTQHTIQLPRELTGEIGGFCGGPGIWGGVFEYRVNWSLNVGL